MMRTKGVDTVAYAFPVAGVDDGDGAQFHAQREDGRLLNVTTLRRLDGGGTLRTGVGGYGVVEASIPKLEGGRNVEPASWPVAVEAIRGLYERAKDHVQVAEAFEMGRFTRADVDRDFEGCYAWPVVAEALERAVYAPRASTRLFRDKSRSSALTLAVGNASWRAMIYDKGAETMLPEAEGRLRYEYRAGKRMCHEHKVTVRSLGDLEAHARSVFEHTRFHAKVGGMNEVWTRILDAEGLSTRERMALLGWLTAESHGIRLDVSEKTARKYRAICVRYGLSVSVSQEHRDSTIALDYEAGRMRLEAA